MKSKYGLSRHAESAKRLSAASGAATGGACSPWRRCRVEAQRSTNCLVSAVCAANARWGSSHVIFGDAADGAHHLADFVGDRGLDLAALPRGSNRRPAPCRPARSPARCCARAPPHRGQDIGRSCRAPERERRSARASSQPATRPAMRAQPARRARAKSGFRLAFAVERARWPGPILSLRRRRAAGAFGAGIAP